MLCFPNAKINLGLYVTQKRPDGFHNIESVFYPIPLNDALEFIPSDNGTSSITLEGISLDSEPKDNLVYKAYTLLQHDFKLPNIDISLLKKIPAGAGLGGGSADCAFMLSALNNYFTLNLSKAQLENYALQLGSDCPFFIENAPKAVSGRGEIFQPINLSLKQYSLLLINPGIHISTKEAYSGISPKTPAFDLKTVIEGPVEAWKEKLSNDFEGHILKSHPEIAELKNLLYEAGAVYTSMSGSGSTVFGIFKELPKISLPENYFVFSGQLQF